MNDYFRGDYDLRGIGIVVPDGHLAGLALPCADSSSYNPLDYDFTRSLDCRGATSYKCNFQFFYIQ